MLQTRKSWLFIIFLCLGLIIGSICYADYPLLKTVTYSADPSGLEYNGVLYTYWSNDDLNNGSYQMYQITCLSTTDLKNWTNHGPVFDVRKDCTWAGNSWAPSVVYRDGYFWMYFGNGGANIGVAKSTSPLGPFKDAKGSPIITPSMPNCNVQWCFDPGVFVDDNGRVYMYFGGGGPGNLRAIELGSDMISTIGTAVTINAPRFFEAAWVHKYNGKYYLSYSSDFSQGAATIEYMMSSSPMSGYTHKGTVMPNPPNNNGNNNHQSIFQYRGNWYIAYHNRYLASRQGIDPTYKRNACLDQLFYNADGTIKLVTCTQNGLPLLPTPTLTSTPTPTPTPTLTATPIVTPTPTPTPAGSYVRFRNAATGLFIDGMGSTSNGSNACQWGDSSSANQQWTIINSGGYMMIQNRATGLYLDGMGRTSNGSVCGQWSSSGSANQQWTQEASGSYVRFKNRATGLYLDGMGSTGNGSNLCQWSSSGSANQQWQIR
jgi:hypothetical protein